MIVQHNIAAMNSNRQLGINSSGTAKSMEKLSSGFRINRAGDDAAGLTISEKMRSQVKGLNQATRNAQDGISLIQTAEGALSETHNILQRMRVLADQSSNGTNTDTDREAIQEEIKQLSAEIDRIGNTTEFNTKKLLNGSLDGDDVARGASIATGTQGNMKSAAPSAGWDFSDPDMAPDLSVVDILKIDGEEIEVDWGKYLNNTDIADINADYTDTEDSTKLAAAMEKAINAAIVASGKDVGPVTVTGDAAGVAGLTITSSTKGLDSKVDLIKNTGNKIIDANGNEATKSLLSNIFGTGTVTATAGDAKLNNQIDTSTITSPRTPVITLDYNGTAIKLDTSGSAAGDVGTLLNTANASLKDVAAAMEKEINASIAKINAEGGNLSDIKVNVTKDGGLSFEGADGAISFSGDEFLLKDLGIDAKSLQDVKKAGGDETVVLQIGANQGQTLAFAVTDVRAKALGINKVDVSTQEGAQKAISTLDTAIAAVSKERSKLGAIQNRLEHTIANLGTSAENLTASESRIRDTDMAAEMMEYTKNNILAQASQSMLAQANQRPQSVLQLLG